MWQNILSIVVIVIVGGLLYAQRNLRLCAKDDTDEADKLDGDNRDDAMELAVAGGFNPRKPKRGGGIEELAQVDGMTRALMQSGHKPAEIFGLTQKSNKAKSLRKRAKNDRRLANILIVVAVVVAAVYLHSLIG